MLVLFYPNWKSLHFSLCCCSLSRHCCLSPSCRCFLLCVLLIHHYCHLLFVSFSPTHHHHLFLPFVLLTDHRLLLYHSQDLKLSPLFEINLVTCSFGVVVRFWWCRVTMWQWWWSGRRGVIEEGGDRCRRRVIGIEEEGFWGWIF